jgi:hypothetical protein
MTDMTIFNGNNMPAYLQQAKSGLTDALSGGNAGGDRISIRGRAWRLIQDGQEVAASADIAMPLVIIDALPQNSRIFHASAYQEGDNSPPTCWSSDGTAPDQGVATPCSNSCATCPQNVPGSSGRGESRACKTVRRVAVAIPSRMDRAYLMQLPATTIFGDKVADDQPKPLTQYSSFLRARNVDITAVVTRFQFDINETSPTIRFAPDRFLTEQEFHQACELMRDPTTKDKLRLSFNVVAPAAPAPAFQPTPGYQPVQQPAQQPQFQQPAAPVNNGFAQQPAQGFQQPAPQQGGFQQPAPVNNGFAQPAPQQGFQQPAPQQGGFEQPAPQQGFQPTEPVAEKAKRSRRAPSPADAAPVVVTAQEAGAATGAGNTVGDLLNKWGA